MSDNYHGDRSLRTYRAKRDAGRTPEPFGGRVAPQRPGGAGIFVVQEHAASRRHYDLRLELDGVLVSWAVPKGPSLDPGDKRLAVQVEPHPLEYATFEGIIPEGNYGAGAMIVWDTGMWVPVEDPSKGLAAGKLLFDLHGYKLRGRWTLVRTQEGSRSAGAGTATWLLIKKPDSFADPTARLSAASVLSGLSVDELSTGSRRAAELRGALTDLGAPQRPVDIRAVRPMLCQTAPAAFSGPEWLFELKYDGYRMLAGVDRGQVYLRYRSGLETTALFPELARALACWPVNELIIDGEVVAPDDRGRPVFHRLQQRSQLQRATDIQRAAEVQPVCLMAFDLLACEGFDLRPLPLAVRKEILAQVVPEAGPIRYADHIEHQGQAFFAEVIKLGLEGVVAKRADAPYRGGRSDAWRKVRVERDGDFAIVGYTSPLGSRVGFGSLHLAIWDGEWVYAGRVGTGFDDRTLRDLYARLQALPAWQPTFVPPSSPQRADHWVEPNLVCTVKYLDWTEDRQLRFPVFSHLRIDKQPRECERPTGERDSGTADADAAAGGASASQASAAGPAAEASVTAAAVAGAVAVAAPAMAPAEPVGLVEPKAPAPTAEPTPAAESTPESAPAGPAESAGPAGLVEPKAAAPTVGAEECAEESTESVAARAAAVPAVVPAVQVTNADKVFWPGHDGKERYTKGDLVRYYRAVAPWLLPYLRDRPVVLTRFPDGIAGKSFFQKDAPQWVPDWIRLETLWSRNAQREVRYFICENQESVTYLANMATIPLHIWSSRVASLARPDWAILDLDPKQAPFAHVVTVARAAHDLCSQLELPSFIKTSGATGVHVLVPLGGACTYEQSRALAQLLAKVLEVEHADIATTTRRVDQRGGRVYLDYLQNGHGRLLVAPFSVRPLPGAPVSMPLCWHEVDDNLDVSQFTIANAIPRLHLLGRDPLAPVLTTRIDLPRALALLSERLHRAT